ncbi:MAG TPA: ATP-binding protein [Phnomibacter sp.]|nr:ATP-binding protein [Phnomibacter sp.]
MNGTFIILIVVCAYLRKALNTKNRQPEWDRILLAALYVSILGLALQVLASSIRPFLDWAAHAMLLGFIYLAFKHPVFQPVRTVAVALLPLELKYLADEITKKISPGFYSEWKNYFEAAGLFAVVWLVAMLIINNRQRKALAKQQAIAEEKEKEFKKAEEMKAVLAVQVAERTAELQGQKQALETALDELKATQSQLIQSEKMASLGELTAGIAHEIQNPLNFVNNFSEVSHELLTEMVEEIEKGNKEEVKSIARDLQQNLEKINHHGKRADAIVKGMLQHSRSSTGIKEPTDINALADEYLRLAYHGLRAKDKSFNASMQTDFDPQASNIPVIPQDMGRVILNLITNAFYAVAEKKKQQPAGYEPIVKLGTKRQEGTLVIRVQDNGNGIPRRVIDKIFQPFFTTKPAGEGTGLGLSMSYDIVTKGHGGELQVETQEGEGTTFTIQIPIQTP